MTSTSGVFERNLPNNMDMSGLSRQSFTESGVSTPGMPAPSPATQLLRERIREGVSPGASPIPEPTFNKDVKTYNQGSINAPKMAWNALATKVTDYFSRSTGLRPNQVGNERSVAAPATQPPIVEATSDAVKESETPTSTLQDRTSYWSSFKSGCSVRLSSAYTKVQCTVASALAKLKPSTSSAAPKKTLSRKAQKRAKRAQRLNKDRGNERSLGRIAKVTFGIFSVLAIGGVVFSSSRINTAELNAFDTSQIGQNLEFTESMTSAIYRASNEEILRTDLLEMSDALLAFSKAVESKEIVDLNHVIESLQGLQARSQDIIKQAVLIGADNLASIGEGIQKDMLDMESKLREGNSLFFSSSQLNQDIAKYSTTLQSKQTIDLDHEIEVIQALKARSQDLIRKAEKNGESDFVFFGRACENSLLNLESALKTEAREKKDPALTADFLEDSNVILRKIISDLAKKSS